MVILAPRSGVRTQLTHPLSTWRIISGSCRKVSGTGFKGMPTPSNDPVGCWNKAEGGGEANMASDSTVECTNTHTNKKRKITTSRLIKAWLFFLFVFQLDVR